MPSPARERHLWAIPILEAQRLKWEAGRRAYGGDSFQGDPLAELYAELIDGLNYCEEAARRGADLRGIPRGLRAAAVTLRGILRARGEREERR